MRLRTERLRGLSPFRCGFFDETILQNRGVIPFFQAVAGYTTTAAGRSHGLHSVRPFGTTGSLHKRDLRINPGSGFTDYLALGKNQQNDGGTLTFAPLGSWRSV